jgi:hypothetical protein
MPDIDRTELKPLDPNRTVSTEWAVHIHGMDEVLPALGRRDAHERAHKANDAAVWNETHREPDGLDEFRPIIWAVPVRMPVVPDAMTVAEVEQMWEQWNA